MPIGRNLTNLEQIEQIKKYPIGLPLFEHESHESHEWPTDGGFEHLKTRKGRMDSGRKYAQNPISYPKSMEKFGKRSFFCIFPNIIWIFRIILLSLHPKRQV